MAIDTIKATAILDGAVDTADLADGAVSSVKIANGAVDTTQLANDAVSTDKITDGNVTVGKLASTLDLSSNTVTLPDGNITTAKLDDGAVTAGKIGSLPAGSVLQVVQGTLTSQVVVTSTSFIDIGLSASITPSSATSKILIMYGLHATGYTGNEYANIRLFRDTTNLLTGDADGNRTPTFSSVGANSNNTALMMSSGNYLDSPNTTSATTYSVKVRSYDAGGANSAYINRPLQKDNLSNSGSPCSTILLMEIA